MSRRTINTNPSLEASAAGPAKQCIIVVTHPGLVAILAPIRLTGAKIGSDHRLQAHHPPVGLALSLLAVATLVAGSATADSLADIRALAAEKRFVVALKKLDERIAAHPDDVEASLYRGVIFTRQGELDRAIEAFAALAREHPELPEPHNNLAVLYAAQNRYEEARLALLDAIRLQPRYDTAHENLGDLYAKLASMAYERAHRLNDDNHRARIKAESLTRAFEVELPWVADPLADDPEQELPTLAGPTCYRFGAFHSEEELAPVARWLAERGIETKAEAEVHRDLLGYLVYLPPLESRAAAEVQIARMQAEGIEDIARITEAGVDNAIALGVYRTEAAAERRATRLRALGYQPSLAARHRFERRWWLQTSAALDAGMVGADLAAAFPSRRLTRGPCRS